MAIFALIGWGFWTFFAKIASEELMSETVMIISYLGAATIGIGYVLFSGKEISISNPHFYYAIIGSVFAGLGGIAFYAALKSGNTGIVTTVSSLYFIVAAILGVIFLGESLSIQNIAGILLAGVAVYLLSI